MQNVALRAFLAGAADASRRRCCGLWPALLAFLPPALLAFLPPALLAFLAGAAGVSRRRCWRFSHRRLSIAAFPASRPEPGSLDRG
jgi:hypothetical protein